MKILYTFILVYNSTQDSKTQGNISNLYLSLVCPGKSREEYCLLRADKSFSPLPVPPRAGSNVGLAAVVMATIEMKLCMLRVRR